MAGFLVGDRPSYTPTVDTFNGTGAQTAFTLTQETTTDAAIVFISGVGQLPTGAYSISGTTLTFTSAPPSGTSNIWVTYNQPTGTTAIPSDGSISTAKLADDAVTLAKLAAGTDGELITWDASGNPTTVGVGTAAQVLTSNGAGAAPTFQDIASAAWEYVSGQTISSPVSTVEFTGFEDNYDYLIVFDDLHWTTNGAVVLMQFGTGVTPTWQIGNYTYYCHAIYGQTFTMYTGATGNGGTSNQARLFFNSGIANASRPCMGSVEIRRPKDNQHTAALVSGMCPYSTVDGLSSERGAFVHRTDAIVTAAKIYRSSGTIDDGKFRLYRRSFA